MGFDRDVCCGRASKRPGLRGSLVGENSKHHLGEVARETFGVERRRCPHLRRQARGRLRKLRTSDGATVTWRPTDAERADRETETTKWRDRPATSESPRWRCTRMVGHRSPTWMRPPAVGWRSDTARRRLLPDAKKPSSRPALRVHGGDRRAHRRGAGHAALPQSDEIRESIEERPAAISGTWGPAQMKVAIAGRPGPSAVPSPASSRQHEVTCWSEPEHIDVDAIPARTAPRRRMRDEPLESGEARGVSTS